MRFKPTDYAKAYMETKPATQDILGVVEKHGDMGRLEKILAEIEKLVVKEAGGRMINMEFARKTDMVEKFKFKPHDSVHVSINPLLVAGVRITIDGSTEFDNSLVRKINTLWHTK